MGGSVKSIAAEIINRDGFMAGPRNVLSLQAFMVGLYLASMKQLILIL